MNTEIKDYVRKCDLCCNIGPQQSKETLISHQVPDRPWAKIATDLFEFDGKEYLVTVDYFSNFFDDFFELFYLSDFKLEENSMNCLSKKPSKINLSTFSTSILHQFGQWNLVRIAPSFQTFACVLGCYFLEFHLV